MEDRRNEIIAVAEAYIVNANVGRPELMSAEFQTSEEKYASTIRRLKHLGSPDRIIRGMENHLANKPPKSGWTVNFILYDDRYVDGITIATVKIDEASGEIEMDVTQRTSKTTG